MTTLVWFRDDLRVRDNPALLQASRDPEGVVCVYLLDEQSPETRALGGAAKWWLHQSLMRLSERLAELGAPLLLERGAARGVIPRLIWGAGAGAGAGAHAEVGVPVESGAHTEGGANVATGATQITRVVWNRRYGPEKAIDADLKLRLRNAGVAVQSFAANLLHEPWTVQTKTGGAYKVYSPFWRACGELPVRAPVPAPDHLTPASVELPTQDGGRERSASSASSASSAAETFSTTLASWNLRPSAPDWSAGLADRWTPGEDAAHRRLATFLGEEASHAAPGSAQRPAPIDEYAEHRDEPADDDAVSGLSPHLRWGEISPATVWRQAIASGRSVGTFLSELGWREFAWHTLFQHPDLATTNLDRRFDAFPWRAGAGQAAGAAMSAAENPELRAWQQGRTGEPLVDAGMRELWQTGVMHNRVRMVAASYLAKNLMIDWRAGERWFWDTLVDADAASNPFNWQWVAGCGADAAPYFRIFNPETQRRRFDPQGEYVDRWQARQPGIEPLVDLRASRARALAAYAELTRTPRWHQ
ncbi:cryptochrome/photolyase family protein [Pseudoclavibacter sp. 13-3]|uniref:cryptochrome/photolyase family protein n=1 Tax=Pseudoclavibacter sp. 13-3 TaxID=2901228 RepID=UPI001E5CCEEB|nr:deoxyribodipyrimidine photo-lyase [Pseudoclavibacter sp. 13-3]MCD7100781.1 DNA photolyase family protein [Pseudoclavibacter sp. 13-3]